MTAPAVKETPDPPKGKDWVEIVATIVLALAAVATAWSSYQATRWNGEGTKASGRVNAVRIEAARAQGLAEGQTQVDIALFLEWVNATVEENSELQDFYAERFRAEFKPAFDAWMATDPLTTTGAPPSPFAMDEYLLEAEVEAEQLDAEAELLAAEVRLDVQRAANYILGVVLFAVALFFAGMSARVRGAGARKALLIIGCVVFVGAAAWIATFPISLSL